MDIHDGNVLFIDGTYYWYGASYGDCIFSLKQEREREREREASYLSNSLIYSKARSHKGRMDVLMLPLDSVVSKLITTYLMPLPRFFYGGMSFSSFLFNLSPFLSSFFLSFFLFFLDKLIGVALYIYQFV